MTTDINVRILKFLNKFLHESLFLEFEIVLIFFCNLNIPVLYGEFPLNIVVYVFNE